MQAFERQLARTSGREQPTIMRIRGSAGRSADDDLFEAAGAEETPGAREMGVGFLEGLEEFQVVEVGAAAADAIGKGS